MPRIRTVKPELFTSGDVQALSIHARWSFLGLWTYVTDDGRGRADPRLIKAAVWPIDDSVSADDVAGHLDEMERRAMICRYSENGADYLHVVNFPKHQRINRPSAEKHPACSKDVHGGLSEPSLSPHVPLTEPSPPELELELEPGTGTGNREQGTGIAATPPAPRPRDEVALFDHDDLADVVAIPNAGQLNRLWIDHCARVNVKLPQSIIKRYGAGIKKAMDDGFEVDLIKRALARMLDEGRASHPAELPTFLVKVQHGPGQRERRLTPGEASMAKLVQTDEARAVVMDMLTPGKYGPKAVGE